nr:swi5-dependent recombination DNA repair protein 1 homolog [Hydra vulgaris]
MITDKDEESLLILKKNFERSEKELLKKEKDSLSKILKCKEEELRKLRLLKSYKAKNDLTHLEELITKWRSVAVMTIEELHTKNNNMSEKITMTQFLNMLQIDPLFIHYDAESESFK